MQLVHLISIGNLNENLDKEKLVITHQSNDISENRENDKNENVTNQIKNIDQIKEKTIKNPELSTKADSKREIIKSFNDLINLANKEKEVELKYDLERNVKLVSFSKGKIDISFNEKLNKNFIKLLTEKLLLWTGDRWIISLSKNTGEKTVHEKNLEEQSYKLLKAQNSEESKKILNIFSDAKLIDVSEDNND
jgi:DNA polymerase-3 subunit gamma/tau